MLDLQGRTRGDQKVQASQWLEVLQEEYLACYIKDGGSAIKVVSGAPEVLSRSTEGLRHAADRLGYFFVHLDAGVLDPQGKKPDLHRVDRFLFAILQQVELKAWAAEQARRYLQGAGINLAPLCPLDDLNAIAEDNGRDASDLLNQYNRDLQASRRDRGMSTDFRLAVNALLRAQLIPEAMTPTSEEVLLQWFAGRTMPGAASALRKMQIHDRIGQGNARAIMQSFCHWLPQTGRSGLVTVLDLRPYEYKKLTQPQEAMRKLAALRGAVQRGASRDDLVDLIMKENDQEFALDYSNPAYAQMLSLLRRFIDEIERFEQFLLVVLTTPAFYDPQSPRNYHDYDALQTRIGLEVHDVRRPTRLLRWFTSREPAHGPRPGRSVMTTSQAPSEAVSARRALEALRSGVPSRYAVQCLGTTQESLDRAFRERLADLEAGRGALPLVVSGGFGEGKSHLLEYLQGLSEQSGYVTAYLVVSPEMPLGLPQFVMKALAESASAPGHVGKALREMAADLDAESPAYAALKEWALHSGLDMRFPALLHLYQAFWADEDLRAQILDDFAGKSLAKSVIKQKLKEIGATQDFPLGNGRGAQAPPRPHPPAQPVVQGCRLQGARHPLRRARAPGPLSLQAASRGLRATRVVERGGRAPGKRSPPRVHHERGIPPGNRDRRGQRCATPQHRGPAHVARDSRPAHVGGRRPAEDADSPRASNQRAGARHHPPGPRPVPAGVRRRARR